MDPSFRENLEALARDLDGDGRVATADWVRAHLDEPREWVIGEVYVPGVAGTRRRILAGPEFEHMEQVRVREVK